jgi:hypothetical protein
MVGMSTGADCRFEERAPSQWHYRLQCWPYGENPDYDEYGPFPTLEKAQEHLWNNHANPGGFRVDRYENRKNREAGR